MATPTHTTTAQQRGAEKLDAWLRKVRLDTIEDALDDLEYALEQLLELARGDRYPGSASALRQEVDSEQERAELAIARLKRGFDEVQDQHGGRS